MATTVNTINRLHGILGPQFDKAEEKTKLAEQVQGQDALETGGSEPAINPRGGKIAA